METFCELLAICARNSPVTVEFPAQRPVTRSFDVFFDLRLNKRLSKQLHFGEAGDLNCHHAHYDAIVMFKCGLAQPPLKIRHDEHLYPAVLHGS